MNLKNLIKIFSEHEKRANKQYEEDLIMFHKNNGSAKPPDYLTDDFNLPAALKFMCEEIADIKKKGCK